MLLHVSLTYVKTNNSAAQNYLRFTATKEINKRFDNVAFSSVFESNNVDFISPPSIVHIQCLYKLKICTQNELTKQKCILIQAHKEVQHFIAMDWLRMCYHMKHVRPND